MSKHNFLLLIVSIFISTNLNATCSFSFNSLPNVIFTSTTNSQTISYQISVVRPSTGNTCKDFHITFTYGNSGVTARSMTNGSYSIPYNLYQNSSTSRIIYDYPILTNSNNALQGTFGNSSTTLNRTFYAKKPAISPSQDGGIYTDTITAKLYDKKVGQGGALITSATFSVTFNMPKTLRISLVESNAPFNAADTYQQLLFGTLTNGLQKDFDLRVESNTHYSIGFSSQNNGKLKHQTNNALISYLFKINNTSFNLNNSAASPLTLIYSFGTGPMRDEIFPIAVQIQDITNKPAGDYSDFITVEATSLE